MAYAILVVSAILIEFAVNLPTGSLPLALASDGVGPTGIATVAFQQQTGAGAESRRSAHVSLLARRRRCRKSGG